MGDGTSSPTELLFKAQVALLHARTGVAVTRTLIGPATGGPQGGASIAFGYGGIAAIDYKAASDVVAACSLPRAGLPPPAVLVWDWRSGTLLSALLLHPLPPDPPMQVASTAIAGQRPLRFAIGARWSAAWTRRSGTRRGGLPLSQQRRPGAGAVRLRGGARPRRGRVLRADRPPRDHPAVSAGEVYWNARTNAMEVAAKARLALHLRAAGSRSACGTTGRRRGCCTRFRSGDVGMWKSCRVCDSLRADQQFVSPFPFPKAEAPSELGSLEERCRESC